MITGRSGNTVLLLKSCILKVILTKYISYSPILSRTMEKNWLLIKEQRAYDIDELKALIAYQYHPKAVEILDQGSIRIEKSEKTGRIKHVFINEKLVASIRAPDGYLLFSIEGAKLFLSLVPPLTMRVVIAPEIATFIAKGRSVFSKHVLQVDKEIRPGEEIFVVTPEDSLVAIGRAVLSGWEMGKMEKGVAVKIRKGLRK